MPTGTIVPIPKRCTSRGACGASTIMTSGIGSMMRPAWNGEYPSTICRYCVERNATPNIAKKHSAMPTAEMLNRGLFSSCRSNIGSSVVRSRTTKATKATTATANASSVWVEPQPCSGASMIAYTSAPMARIDRSAPGMSMRCCSGSRDSGSRIRPATMATARSGTLMRNTDPHQKCSTRKPEIGGPSAAPPAAMPAQMLIAFGPLVRLEHVGQQRQRRRHHERGGEAHHRTEGDHLVGGVGHRRGDRTEQEQHHAGLQHELAAESVADRAGGEQHAGEHQAVGVDHPLQRAARRVQVLGHLRQGHVEAAVGDHDHHQAEAQHDEDLPAVGVHDGIDRGEVVVDHGVLAVGGVTVLNPGAVAVRTPQRQRPGGRRAASSPTTPGRRASPRPQCSPPRRAAGRRRRSAPTLRGS